MATQREIVVLDTTVLVAEGYGSSRRFDRLLLAHRHRRVEVIVPELCVIEAAAIAERKLRRLSNRERAGVFVALAGAGFEVPRNLQEVSDRIQERLRSALEEAGAPARRVDTVRAEDIVRRVMEGKRPSPVRIAESKEDEPQEGFRDQLVWAHVREQAKDRRLSFISSNTDDFGADDVKGRDSGPYSLHPDLLEDLKGDGIDVDRVIAYRDLAAFASAELRDTELLERVHETLSADPDAFSSVIMEMLVHISPIQVDGYLPVEPLESEIEADTGAPRALRVDSTQLAEIYELDEENYDVIATVPAEVDVDWYTAHPSAWDLEIYGSAVEAPDAGGLIQDHELNVPVMIEVGVTLTIDPVQWKDPALLSLRLDPGEEERRTNTLRDWQLVRDNPAYAKLVDLPEYLLRRLKRE